ncbi:phosphate acetyltransferase [Pontitalea aquivivens]|uniref:phosphate acetyltransferase n=1 Tax=Pontitalea aquivivens TaxID=3388663 RepID=UPI003970BB3B
MKALDHIFDRARQNAGTVILPEGGDPRVQAAGLHAQRDGLARIVLLGDPAQITPALAALGARPGEIRVEAPGDYPRIGVLASVFHALRAHKGMTLEKARELVCQPHLHAALRVFTGDAIGTVGGAVATTAETVRVALQTIGREPGLSTVSSFFLMLSCTPGSKLQGGMIFSDCGLVIEPNAQELAAIARASARSCRQLLNEEPRIALLSFSTAGSAEHESLHKIREALAIVRAAEPELQIDGEIQFDAALDHELRARKAPGSRLEGRPNVFVFPNLAAGNIGYKIAERLAGMQAVGPILQGLRRPANDLSRGCSVEDIVATIAVTVVQAIDCPQIPKSFAAGHAGCT